MKIFKLGLAKRFSTPSKGPNFFGNAYMFIEDMSISIAPLCLSDIKNLNFSYEVIGNDEQLALIYLKEISRDSYNYGTTKICCRLINELARNLLYFGEIHFQLSKKDGNSILTPVSNQNLFNVPFLYFQIIPKEDLKHYKSRSLWAKKKDVFKFSLFENKISILAYRLMLKALNLSTEIFPRFYMDNVMENPYRFDHKLFSKWKALFISIISYKFSWPQRSLSNEFITEYYLIQRHLKHEACKADIRLKIINQLNELFLFLKLDAKIIEKGLPTPKEILNHLDKIKNGVEPLSSFTKWSKY